MKTYRIDAVPFSHKEIDIWRENFKGIQYLDENTNLIITGAVDDIWLNSKDELLIVDYKSTSKETEVNLDAEWQDGYKRQVEVYQWLFRMNGFKVSDTAYFVYANGQKDRAAFDGKLEFDVKIIPYVGNSDWISYILIEIKKCLESEKIPDADPECDYCAYRKSAENALKN